MTTRTVSITLTSSPTSSQPSSPLLKNDRPNVSTRASSWSGVANYTMSAWCPSTTNPASDSGEPSTTLSAFTAPDSSLSRLSLTPDSRNVSPKQSLDAGQASPSARAGSVTPLTAMDKVFDVPASEGLAQRLKELAEQTGSSVLEVLRRLSEAERQSSMVRASSTKKELREYFATFMTISELGLDTCFQLDLPLATWEHVVDQVLMEGHSSRTDLATAIYWRARHRKGRMDHYRLTGRTSG